MEEHSSAERKTWQVLRFEKKTIVWLDLNESTKTLNPLSAERKGKVDPYRGSEEEEKRKKKKEKRKKSAGTNSEKSGTRNLAA